MILKIEGEINKFYVQTLCMVFFPGATFAEGEASGEDVPEVSVRVYDFDGGKRADVSLKLNDRFCEATATVLPDENVLISTAASIAVGRALFSVGKEILGHTPPWGILTGVRPAKVAVGLLGDGKGILKSKKILRDEYFLHPQKAALATSVASSELKIIKKMQKNTASLYISIPFCPSRCSYCSFVSYTTPRLLSMIDEYLDALIFDLEKTFETVDKLGMRITTVYIGGGTPTTLNEAQLSRLLSKIGEHIDTSELLEFTLEAGRPDTITEQKLKIAKEAGVTRVSVNPQTLNDRILKEIGRRHTAEDFYRAYSLAQNSGIKDINVDIIAGLPADDFKSFSATVDKIIELAPTNITVHTFCVKKASDALRNNSNIYSASGGDAAKCVSYSQLKAKFAGYKPYYMYRQKNTVGNLENVGFSIEGHEGLYNVFMMEEVQTIFAVGAGSVTKLVKKNENGTLIKRLFKPKYPYEYLRESDRSEKAKEQEAEILEFFSE